MTEFDTIREQNKALVFNMTVAMAAVKQMPQKQGSSSRFDTQAVLDILKELGEATPAQVSVAYNAGYGTDIKSKVFSDWLWQQEKKHRLTKNAERHTYSLNSDASVADTTTEETTNDAAE